MAEPGLNPHPSARGGGRSERRTSLLLWLLLWAGTTFQVTLGTGPELHACKEVLFTPPPGPDLTLVKRGLVQMETLGIQA